MAGRPAALLDEPHQADPLQHAHELHNLAVHHFDRLSPEKHEITEQMLWNNKPYMCIYLSVTGSSLMRKKINEHLAKV